MVPVAVFALLHGSWLVQAFIEFDGNHAHRVPGFNDTAQAADGKDHNFSFTTEIHTSFVYNGGETFTFKGDDDVWVFINDKLAIDLGGIHAQETQSVALDSQAAKLGITKGKTYPLAVFNAERHVVQSNFRIDTTLTFTNCGFVEGTIY